MRELVEIGYCGERYVDVDASGNAVQKATEPKHEPTIKTTTWRLNG